MLSLWVIRERRLQLLQQPNVKVRNYYKPVLHDWMIDWLFRWGTCHPYRKSSVPKKNRLKDARAGRPCASVLRKLCFCLYMKQIKLSNQIIINSVKHAMCNIHINDNYSKYFVYNNSNIILFYSDFTNNSLYDIALVDVIFRFWVTSQ